MEIRRIYLLFTKPTQFPQLEQKMAAELLIDRDDSRI